MSKTVFEGETMYVSRHVGPALDDEGELVRDRQRWQFTPLGDDHAILTRREVRALVIQLVRDAWPRRYEPRRRDDAEA